MLDRRPGRPGIIATLLIGAMALALATSRSAAADDRGDPARGKDLFVAKGCVICHAVNEVGGTSAPPLDAEAVPTDPLDFVARMWRGAEAMIFMQQDAFGEQILFTGDELADIIAFVHDARARRGFSEDDIPAGIWRLIRARR